MPANADPAHAANLVTIACAAADDCSAAGQFFTDASEWHALLLDDAGGTWTSDTKAPPGDWTGGSNPSVSMRAMACMSAGNCIVSGAYTGDSGSQQNAFWVQSSGTWDDGVAARVPADADFNPQSVFNAVSCSSADCVAVGYYTDTNGWQQGAIDVVSSGSWSSDRPPVPADADRDAPDAAVNAVACVSSGECSAGGLYYTHDVGYEKANLLTRVLGGWSSTEMAFPHGVHAQEGYLSALSCVSEGNCVAVGTYRPGEGDHALIEEETSGTWASVDRVLPSDADLTGGNPDSVTAVACPSAGNCVAVGTYTDENLYTQPLMLTETSGEWGEGVSAALPDTAGNPSTVMTGVSCLSAGECVAVGYYQNSSSYQEPFTITLAGGTWTAAAAALPANANAGGNPIAAFTGVSCAGTRCVAVGYYQDDSGVAHGLLDVFTGGSWRTGVEAPIPTGGTEESLLAVSCPSAGHCRAVGNFDTPPSGYNHMALLTETAADTWSAVAGTLPDDADANAQPTPTSISCAADNCGVVGTYLDTSGHRRALVLSQPASGTWAEAPSLALPAGADATQSPGASLDGVSCLAGGYCTAVGRFEDSGGNWHGMVVSESAWEWGTLVAAAKPSDADGTYPQDSPVSVACVATGACASAGSYYVTPSRKEPMLLERSAYPGTSTSTSTTATTTTATTTSPAGGGAATTTGTAAATTTSATATTAVAPAVPTVAGSISVGTGTQAVTVAWQPGAVGEPATMSVTLAPLAVTGVVFQAGTQPVQLTVTSASGAPITSFAQPLEILFPNAPAGFEPAYSTDGRTWINLPQLAGTTLPAGFRDGWYRDAAGTVHVLTRHATYFGIVDVRSAKSAVAEANHVAFAYTHPLRLARTHVVTVSVRPELPSSAVAVLRRAGRVTDRGTVGAPANVTTKLRLRVAAPGTYRLTLVVSAGRERFTRVVSIVAK